MNATIDASQQILIGTREEDSTTVQVKLLHGEKRSLESLPFELCTNAFPRLSH